MPTIDISTTSALPPARRKAVSVRLARWFADRGVAPAHVIVSFHELGSKSVFSGGMPLDMLASDEYPVGYILVTCRLGPGRDDHFRASLAEFLRTALSAVDGVPFIYIEFRITLPQHVFLAREGVMARADVS
ncbi:hypothetical protein [Nocardia macrotermitis]|uniref:Uncharacterized protein n=1 Tax=Nocardia macrotermitis TaxID=2585198 RepID=A0A7K0D5V0_9NOCA|nr:hypothetical protein [Nocardia macrotermitis]MQY20214.1 hypothetical protein [Nocardia macrotermitis]